MISRHQVLLQKICMSITFPLYPVKHFIILCDSTEYIEFQLNIFRSLWDGLGYNLVDNFRPIQPLNNRTIYYADNSWEWDW